MTEPRRVEPGPGQESVWDYPRPPRLERTDSLLEVRHGGITIASTTRGFRVLETSQPPAFYLPPDDVDLDRLEPRTHSTFCEWKGLASYWSITVGDHRSDDAAWSYPSPTPAFAAITDHLAFYPQR